FVDCGADVGLFTRLVLERAPQISLVHALEPNRKSFFVLERNLSQLTPECHAHCAAVSNHEGMAVLTAPPENDGGIYSDHSKHIKLGEGDVPVTTIDRLNLPKQRPLAIK